MFSILLWEEELKFWSILINCYVHPCCPPVWIMQNYLRPGPTKMPLANWYPAGSNQFHQAIFCLAEMKKPTMLSSQLCWVFKTVPHDLVRRIRFLRIKSSEQDFKYLYWTISKTIVRNLFISKGTSVVHWVGWLHVYACVSCSISIVFVYKYVRVPLSSRFIAECGQNILTSIHQR